MSSQPDDITKGLLPNPDVPRTVALELLWGCNLKCNYCYIGQEKNWLQPVVPKTDKLFSLIDRIVAANVQEIYLVGGEPTAHPKFEQLCEYIAHLAVPVRGICTNGTLITPQIAILLKELDFYVDVSFRGASSEIFDQITGTLGSFQKALKGALTLSEAGISIGIEFDCTTQTAGDLYSLVRMLLDAGIHMHHVFLHRIAPSGDACNLPEHDAMTLQDYQIVFEQANRITTEFALPVAFEDGFPLCLIDQSYWQHVVPCECGTFLATVDPQGNVRRCACHPHILGNLFKTELTEIWSHALETFRSLSWQDDSCKSCALFTQCRGGCPVSSPHNSQSFAPDVFHKQFVPLNKTHISPTSPTFKGLLGQKIIDIQ